jgi:Flp pilus assembly protein TadD
MRVAVLLIACLALDVTAARAQLVEETVRQEALKHYRAGQELLMAEQWQRAADEFMDAIDLDPLLTLAHYGLGQAYMGLKQYRSAVRAFSGCREAFRQLHLLAASNKLAVERRQDDEIRELNDTLSAMQSPRIKSSNPLTVSRMEDRIRELQKTRNQGLIATQEFQSPSEVSLALGSAYFRAGDLAQAETSYVAAINVNPRMGEAHNNLAVIYMITGRLNEAEKEVQLAEQAGFRVNPMFKDDLRKRRGQSD